MNLDKSDQFALLMGHITARAWADADFKNRLCKNPVPILTAMGLQPPPGLNIVALAETTATRYVTIPAPWMENEGPDFVQRLKQDPKSALRSAGRPVDERANYTVLENTASAQHLVIPLAPNHEEMSIEVIDAGS